LSLFLRNKKYEELHNLYSSTIIIMEIMSRTLWAAYGARLGEMISAYEVLVEKGTTFENMV
jgi:hypothetical protein